MKSKIIPLKQPNLSVSLATSIFVKRSLTLGLEFGPVPVSKEDAMYLRQMLCLLLAPIVV